MGQTPNLIELTIGFGNLIEGVAYFLATSELALLPLLATGELALAL